MKMKFRIEYDDQVFDAADTIGNYLRESGIEINPVDEDADTDGYVEYEISTENQRKTVINKLSDDDLLSNAIRFAFDKCPQDENGALVDFQKYKQTFYKSLVWFRDNYEPVCDEFLGAVESK